MSLDLRDLSLSGPALPEPFVKFELEEVLTKWKLLRRLSAVEGRSLEDFWETYRRRLRALAEQGGAQRVASHVLEALKERLGYTTFTREESVRTREGDEDGGWIFGNSEGSSVLRAWSFDLGMDLDAPSRRGRAYRFSPERIAERVLLAKGERVGLLTDGLELRVILCDPARTGSHLSVRLDRMGGWRGAKSLPDSFRLVQALCAPAGVSRVAELVDLARLSQSRVTKTLRAQAETAVLGFVQALLDDPRNTETLARLRSDPTVLARTLWGEALVVIYRLLFILRLESTADPARAFTFASTSLWRNSFSPNTALARYVRDRLDHHVETGAMLGDGLRTLFRLFEKGVSASELRVVPLGGMLFGEGTTPLLDSLAWSEDGVALLLDRLLWTPRGRGERQRVHYGALEVEDLGRVYEGLLEKEPGLSTEPMCRLRRQKLEVVLPLVQGQRYRPATPVENTAASEENDEAEEGDESEESDEGTAKKAKVLWIEEIPTGRFYLRVGLGRKATGSYYTPDAFVRFLVEKTLGPQVQERSPVDDPNPFAILKIKVLDPAMGSGHFLVGACRYLADKLYEACRLCDEKAAQARHYAENASDDEARAIHEVNAKELLERVEVLPDPNDELLAYLPSRVAEADGGALAQAKALALCRRLVAVHCLYGVDKNPLAVGLAKLALWLESYAEGLPLTFMDHRLVCGDSLTGPFIEHLATLPGRAEKMADDLFERVGAKLLGARIADALGHVKALEASIGKDVAEVVEKRAAKERLDRALEPLRILARVWSGGVMLGGEACDDAGYMQLVAVAAHEEADAIPAMEAVFAGNKRLQRMREVGAEGVAYELTFPEVFWPKGYVGERKGFDAVLGNPPWDRMLPADKEFFASYDLRVLEAPTKKERDIAEKALRADPIIGPQYVAYVQGFRRIEAIRNRTYRWQAALINSERTIGKQDAYRLFMERCVQVLGSGSIGLVVPSGFHANEGATGVRQLYLQEIGLRTCFCFENSKRLFEIHASFKFAVIVADRKRSDAPFECAFYLHDPEWLFAPTDPLKFSLNELERMSGEVLTFLEVRSSIDAVLAKAIYASGKPFGVVRNSKHIALGRELNMTDDAFRFTDSNDVLRIGDPRDPDVAASLREDGFLPLHEGKTFHQYNDHWDERPRYVVALSAVEDKLGWRDAARYYRLAFRDIASSTNERTGIFAVLPPGVLVGHTAPCEREPASRQNSIALLFAALANTYCFDWTLRLKSASHVSLFILDGCPVPTSVFEAPRNRFLAHGALRLTCNHAGYAALWREQLGDETSPRAAAQPLSLSGEGLELVDNVSESFKVQEAPLSLGRGARGSGGEVAWPVLATEDSRWEVRAAIDAVVADAYGLTREQYAHVLSGFSHKSYPAAPTRCLAMYDELKASGLDAFVRAHDPYWDVPLVETLPKPVIELRVPVTSGVTAEAQMGFAGIEAGAAKPKHGRGRGA